MNTPTRLTKDSGLKGLGLVPSHWQRTTIRAITKPVTRRSRSDLMLLSVYRDYGIIPKDSRDDNHNRDGSDLSTYKVVQPGNLVLNKMKTWQGSLGVSEYEGIVSPAYIVCELAGDLNPKFVHYLLRSYPYIFEYNRISYGVRVDQWDMRYDDFKQTPIYLPPRTEQDAIVTFLDERLADIDHYITAKQRLIELLNEQKAALINRVVTRGLNPDAPLKESGIPGHGKAPSDWQKVKVGQLVEIEGGSTPNKSNETYWVGNIPWVSPKDMKLPTILDSEDHISSLALEETSIRLIEPPVLLIVVRGMILARRVPVAVTAVPVTINQDMKALHVNGMCVLEYLKLVFEGLPTLILANVEDSAHGTKKLSTRLLKNIEFMLPPKETQKQILAAVEDQFSQLQKAILTATCEIELIQELRTSLIVEAVTGKLDVKKANS